MREEFQPTVYLLASYKNGTLYTGVTSNLMHRLYQHRNGLMKGFTSKYGVLRLVWFEQHGNMETAIIREKRIKKWNRQWKIDLFAESNPDWRDLAIDLGFEMAPLRRLISRHSRESGNPSPMNRAGDGFPLSRE
ncbi:MAG: GIY-YIG nuclease family protein [Sphingomonadales bacterium]